MPNHPKRYKRTGGARHFSAPVRRALQKKFLEKYEDMGNSMNAICKDMGISRHNIYKWAQSEPEFAKKFNELNFLHKGHTLKEWQEEHQHDEEYKKKFLEVYADTKHSVISALQEIDPKLTTKALTYWRRTDAEFAKEYKKLQYLSRPEIALRADDTTDIYQIKMQRKQERFLQIFREQRFSMTKACHAMGVQRNTVSQWKQKYPDFRAAFDNVMEEKMDFVEDALFDEIEHHNIAAIIFTAKCLLKQRGYIEQPNHSTLTVEHKYDKATIDAVVKAAELSQGAVFDLPKQQKRPEIPETVDATYEEVT